MNKDVSIFEKELTNYAEKLTESLKSGGTEEFKQFLKFSSNFHKYSLNNRILIDIQMKQASKVAGFNAWKQVGRFVKKGEKALTIMAPVFVKRKQTNAQGVEEEKSIMVGTKSVKVFDVSQTDGEAIPQWSIRPNGNDDKGLYELLKKEAKHMGFNVVEEIIGGGTLGSYNRQNNTITIDSSQSLVAKFLTLIHELGHGLLHNTNEKANQSKEDKECQAEATAYIVASHFGLESSVSTDYLICWKNTEKDLIRNLEPIFKASDKILSALMRSTETINNNQETVLAEAS